MGRGHDDRVEAFPVAASAALRAAEKPSGRSKSRSAWPATAPCGWRAFKSAALRTRSSSPIPRMKTRSPRSAKRCAMARPMPLVPPRTTASHARSLEEPDRLRAPQASLGVPLLARGEEARQARLHGAEMLCAREPDPSSDRSDHTPRR